MPVTDIQKKRAHWKVAHAVKKGRLVRQPCEVCGEAKTQAHHDDYGKPLDVRWLCVVCHNRIEHPFTAERTEKFLAAKALNPFSHSEEAKKAIGEASAKRPRSNETRARQSAAIKAWWAKRKAVQQ